MVSGNMPIAIQLVQNEKCSGILHITAKTEREQSTLQQATPQAPWVLRWTLWPCITSFSPGKITPCGMLTCPLWTTDAKKMKKVQIHKFLPKKFLIYFTLRQKYTFCPKIRILMKTCQFTIDFYWFFFIKVQSINKNWVLPQCDTYQKVQRANW